MICLSMEVLATITWTHSTYFSGSIISHWLTIEEEFWQISDIFVF